MFELFQIDVDIRCVICGYIRMHNMFLLETKQCRDTQIKEYLPVSGKCFNVVHVHNDGTIKPRIEC